MPDVFISYSRKDKAFVERLLSALARENRDVWIDWEDIPRAADWLREIYEGIDSADTSVIVVSAHSLASEICNYEIQHALTQRKRIIPLIYQNIEGDRLHQIQDVWNSQNWRQIAYSNWRRIKELNWIFFENEARFNEEFAALLNTLDHDELHVKTHTRIGLRAKIWEQRRDRSLLLTGSEIDEAESWLRAADADQKSPSPTPIQRDYITKSRLVENERRLAIEDQERRIRQFRLAALALAGVLALLMAALVAIGVVAAQAQQALSQAESARLEANQALSDLSGLQLTPIAMMTYLPPAAQWDVRQTWHPAARFFDGVEMVLVPSGCFMMGDDRYEETRPVHEQCIRHLFWIDRYEVTNQQFIQRGRTEISSQWKEPNRPHELIDYGDARDFCELRGGRLPTEAEWEYAARGPDSLLYPWGNEAIAGYAVNNGDFDTGTADVGSHPRDVSWVGAYDMAGNVSEWTSSLPLPYPYDATDGREDPNRVEEDLQIFRVVRGNSHYNTTPSVTLRHNYDWRTDWADIGFRCARDWSPEDDVVLTSAFP